MGYLVWSWDFCSGFLLYITSGKYFSSTWIMSWTLSGAIILGMQHGCDRLQIMCNSLDIPEVPSLPVPFKGWNQSIRDMHWCYNNWLDSTIIYINNLKMLAFNQCSWPFSCGTPVIIMSFIYSATWQVSFPNNDLCSQWAHWPHLHASPPQRGISDLSLVVVIHRSERTLAQER